MILSTLKYNRLWDNFSRYDEWYARMDPYLGQYKAEEFKKLINLWTSGFKGKRILKTDLREEALGEDEILFSLPREAKVYGLDIAAGIVQKADQKQCNKQLGQSYITADIRQIPFADSTFDFILSTSTLDHFEASEDLLRSLAELKRVMKPGGTLILLVNNKRNVNMYLVCQLEKLLRLSNYPVQFYFPNEIKKAVIDTGLLIKDESVTVHIVSPANTLLKISRKIFPQRFTNYAAKACVKFAAWLSKKRTKVLTGWFIALKCVKE